MSAMNVIKLVKVPGIVDLPTTRIKGYFARAIVAEHKAGFTTPEALAFLDQAIDAEAEYYEKEPK